MKYLYGFILIVITVSNALSAEQTVESLFKEGGITGTIVISSLNGETEFRFNSERAAVEFSSASTFKIINTLIALDQGIVTNAQSAIKWDGIQREYESWNSDQTLESAFKVSCVWCYQEFARQIGKARYKEVLSNAGYGDLAEQFNLTSFWLDDGFKVSAEQQIKFLKAFYKEELAFSAGAFSTLKSIMVDEERDDFVLRAKTGWAARVSPQIGWYIGYVESKGIAWFFATNIDIESQDDLKKRKAITLSALKLVGII
jgi:beta-lactamase class D